MVTTQSKDGEVPDVLADGTNQTATAIAVSEDTEQGVDDNQPKENVEEEEKQQVVDDNQTGNKTEKLEKPPKGEVEVKEKNSILKSDPDVPKTSAPTTPTSPTTPTPPTTPTNPTTPVGETVLATTAKQKYTDHFRDAKKWVNSEGKSEFLSDKVKGVLEEIAWNEFGGRPYNKLHFWSGSLSLCSIIANKRSISVAANTMESVHLYWRKSSTRSHKKPTSDAVPPNILVTTSLMKKNGVLHQLLRKRLICHLPCN